MVMKTKLRVVVWVIGILCLSVEAMAETSVELALGETNPNTPSLLCLPVRYAYGGTTKA